MADVQPTQPKKQCSINGCENQARGRGWCKKHWKRWSKYGDPLGKSNYKQVKRNCEVEGCERPYHANGYCSSHEYRAQKYGDPLAQGPGRRSGRKRMEVPSYDGMHKRLWLAYTTDQSRYSPRCKPCHRKRDLGTNKKATPPDHIIEAAIEHPGIIWEEM